MLPAGRWRVRLRASGVRWAPPRSSSHAGAYTLYGAVGGRKRLVGAGVRRLKLISRSLRHARALLVAILVARGCLVYLRRNLIDFTTYNGRGNDATSEHPPELRPVPNSATGVSAGLLSRFGKRSRGAAAFHVRVRHGRFRH